MNITIRLTKVEYEMLKELQKKDKRYKKGLEVKVKGEILKDHVSLPLKDNPTERSHRYLFLLLPSDTND